MTRGAPSSGLIDTSVWAFAIELRRTEVSLHHLWWGKSNVVIFRKLNFHLRKAKPGQESDLSHLPNLAKLIADGRFAARLSDIVDVERDAIHSNWTFSFFGVDVSTIPTLETGIRRRTHAKLTNLRRPASSDVKSAALEESDARYQDLVRILGRSHAVDALHVWTAEKNELSSLILMDKKFKRHFDNMRGRHRSPITLLSPSDLGQAYGLTPATDSELNAIRDIGRQQRLVPMCQFSYPRKWSRRLWMLLNNQFELKPVHGRFERPTREELIQVLWQIERTENSFLRDV